MGYVVEYGVVGYGMGYVVEYGVVGYNSIRVGYNSIRVGHDVVVGCNSRVWYGVCSRIWCSSRV